MTTTLNYILTDDTLTISIRGVPSALHYDDYQYQQIIDLIKDSNVKDVEIAALLDRATAVQKFVQDSDFTFRDNHLFFTSNGVETEVTGTLSRRIIDMIGKKFPVTPLANFIQKLQSNPSFHIHQCAYDFIEYGKLPICPDGDFLAYKKVSTKTEEDGTQTLVDCHSGKNCNNVGTIVKMLRHKVDDNPDNTCSYGLHACSYEYLGSFGGDVIVTVKINPANIVAIPRDYNNTKMRVSEYEVLEVLPLNEVGKSAILSDSPVMSSFKDHSEEFVNSQNSELELLNDDDDCSIASIASKSCFSDARWQVHAFKTVGGIELQHPAEDRSFVSRSEARRYIQFRKDNGLGSNVRHRLWDDNLMSYI